jgi:filamentous hemagglutinin family protein
MAKPRREPNLKCLAVVRQRRAALLLSTALCATVTIISLPAAAQPAPNARPTGGVVVGGNASISQSASQTTINQTSQRGAVNWQSFNVGSQQSVQFNQPSSSAITLNRVVGPNPSEIAGRIDANGQIVIQNQSGVTFYKGSQVNTAGLMVSAATSSNGATRTFLKGGKLVMDQAAQANAAVVNEGHITVKQAGLAAFVAPQVANSGVITAKLGHVELAGGTKATLDLYGDGMLSLDVTGEVTKLPNGATALVTNSGVIVADGGTVRLTARAADGLVTTLVNAGGKIQANSVGSRAGTVTLDGVGGAITVVGQLDAMGVAAGTKGGSIEVNTTGNVTLASGARVDASGQAGGGLVAIGTTLKRAAGGPSVTAKRTAANVTVQAGATIAANATRKGNGGRVTVLSTTSTDMAGTIAAKGGPQGGNGGFVEVSGDQGYALTGSIDVSAPIGTPGTILIDPFDLQVIQTEGQGTEDNNFNTNNGTVLAGDGLTGTPDTIENFVIEEFNGNVELQATHNLEVSASIFLGGTIPGSTLTLRAGNNLTIDNGVFISTNNGNVLFTAADKTITGFTPAGSLTFNGSLNTGSAGVTMSAGTGGIALTGTVIAGLLDLTTTGGGAIQSAGAINVTTLQSTGNVVGDVDLPGVGSPQTTIGNFTVNNGGFTMVNTGSIDVAGALSASGNVSLQTPNSGGVSTSGTGGITSRTSGLIEIIADADNFAGSGKLTATTVELAPNTNGNGVTLGGPGGLSLTQASLAQISAQTLRIGASGTAPNLVTTAGSINVTGSINLAGIATTLDLQSNGSVTESGAGSLNNIGTLTGQTGPVSLAGTLNTGIANIGSYTVNPGGGQDALAGDFTLQTVGNTGISGPLFAANVSITETGASTMNVTGTIAAVGTTSLDAGTIALGTGANVQGTTITLNAASGITMTGDALLGLGGQTNVLDVTTAAGGFTEANTAVISAGTFQSSGGIVGTANLVGANAITDLGSITVTPSTPSGTADFVLNDLSLLDVDGPISAPSGNVFLSSADPNGIAVFGPIDASGRIGLQADSVFLENSISAGVFEVAPFTQGGTLTLGMFADSGLAIGSLTVGEGEVPVQAGLLRFGAVTLPGSATPTTTAGSIVVAGTFDVLGMNLELDATGGISETGAALLNVGTLTGTGGPWALTDSGNTINVLGNITASSFALNDTVPLGVNGILSGGSSATITDTAALSVGGTVTATTVGLTGTDLTIAGLVSATTANLVSSTGSITLDTTSIVQGATITLNAASGITMNGTAALGLAGLTNVLDISTAGGGFTEPSTATIATNTLRSNGGIVGDVSLIGNNTVNAIGNISVAPSTPTGNANFVLIDLSPLDVTGPISVQSGNIFLSSSAPSGISILGTIIASGQVGLLTDALTLESGVTAGTFELAPFTLGGTLTVGTQAAGLSLSALQGNGFAAQVGLLRLGAVTLPGDTSPTTRAGKIVVGGAFDVLNGDLELDATGAIDGTAAPLINVGALSGTGTSWTLTNPGNTINALGNISATPSTPTGSADFLLTDLSPLEVDGLLSVPSGNVFLSSAAPNGISIFGPIDASGRVGVQADSLFLENSISAGVFEVAPFTQGGTLTLGTFEETGLALQSLTVGEGSTVQAGLLRFGAVTLPGSATPTTTAGSIVVAGTFDVLGMNLELDSTGGISETAAALLNVGILTGTGGAWTLTDPGNTINGLGTLAASSFALNDTVPLGINGNLSVGSNATITDTADLSVGGTITATTVGLTGTNLTIAGLVNATGAHLVSTTGSIVETGSLVVGTLTGSAATTADLNGAGPLVNRITALQNFTATNLTLRDGTDLSIAGSLTASNITLLAPTSQISLQDGATIVTGGTARPAGPITVSLEPENGGPGAFIQAAGFTQIGSSSILGIDGPATLQISVTGNMQFDPPLGLIGNTTWLILNLTNGTAAGNVFVNALDVSYTQPGSAALLGSVAGNATTTAAMLASIQPAVNNNYTLNGCIIGATLCQPIVVPPPVVTPPPNQKPSLSLYTSVLGSLYPFLPGTPAPLVALPNFKLVALPVLPAPPGQLTDPDVVPPNISYQDY